jgi:hypothetical protein
MPATNSTMTPGMSEQPSGGTKSANLMMAGARDAGGIRGDDFYPTPPEAVEALLAVERFTGQVWEPACGDGAISKVLSTHGYSVISSDLVDRGFGQGRIDFLLEQKALAPNVVTNPPYKLAEEFAEHAVRLASGKVAFLLRLSWLEGQRRSDLFARMPFARLWVFSRRLPRMHRGDYCGPKATSTMPFCWIVWDRAHSGPPTIGWLK